jgi:hypothetical protein
MRQLAPADACRPGRCCRAGGAQRDDSGTALPSSDAGPQERPRVQQMRWPRRQHTGDTAWSRPGTSRDAGAGRGRSRGRGDADASADQHVGTLPHGDSHRQPLRRGRHSAAPRTSPRSNSTGTRARPPTTLATRRFGRTARRRPRRSRTRQTIRDRLSTCFQAQGYSSSRPLPDVERAVCIASAT